MNGDSNKKRNNDMQNHFSHPSFGPNSGQINSNSLKTEEKWNHLAEKCAMRLLIKNLHV